MVRNLRMRVGGVSETNTSSTLSESESVHVNVSASVTASPSSSTVASPSGKRSRDHEDEVYKAIIMKSNFILKDVFTR